MHQRTAILLLAAAIASSAYAGQDPVPPGGHWANEHLGNWRPDKPHYGFEFVTITHAGNRAADLSERPPISVQYWPNLGKVDYEYRISTTEVTAGQYEPFFHAIRPQWQAAGGSAFGLLNDHMGISATHPSGFQVHEGKERSAIRVEWQIAARFCNWLHNGAPDAASTTADTFTTGAYDVPWGNGVPELPDAAIPLTHMKGAKYRMATMDEWIKAAHYDPNRYGEGVEGYWVYHGTSDVPLIPGLPWEGGETNAGGTEAFGGVDVDRESIPVAAYDVNSPWGLFDTSGQEREWTETPGALVFIDGTILPEYRYRFGDSILNYGPFYDGIDDVLLSNVVGGHSRSWSGIRLVTAIPSPGAGGALLLGAMMLSRRRRVACAGADRLRG